ncbi:hypothetical protein BV898_05747 [Hypsibius exemplaris]|uniref:Transmembrane protein 234-like protein n=1 Tax=Hypsibius exemplaris TaxID=2072580 RepID=A0A1W0WYA7_HYPEX|nr:hypothetical protein BV898_05747 [Hypsibius exemplaris]
MASVSKAPVCVGNTELESFCSAELPSPSRSYFWSCIYLLIAAAFWGCTNPFLRKGTQQTTVEENSSAATPPSSKCSSIISGIKNWKVSLPFAINQCGSLFFYLGIAGAPLSFAVPFANSLTFVITTMTGFVLGEHLTTRHVLGMIAVVAGICICTIDMGKE